MSLTIASRSAIVLLHSYTHYTPYMPLIKLWYLVRPTASVLHSLSDLHIAYMPPFPINPPLHSLVNRDTISSAAKTIGPPVAQVVCAWPVSGQYGFGTRIL